VEFEEIAPESSRVSEAREGLVAKVQRERKQTICFAIVVGLSTFEYNFVVLYAIKIWRSFAAANAYAPQTCSPYPRPISYHPIPFSSLHDHGMLLLARESNKSWFSRPIFNASILFTRQ
jgi:hypothetical protein